jgi:hypothetical protein
LDNKKAPDIQELFYYIEGLSCKIIGIVFVGYNVYDVPEVILK